jgi:uncharacterized repeat protein (TIGR03803 family)
MVRRRVRLHTCIIAVAAAALFPWLPCAASSLAILHSHHPTGAFPYAAVASDGAGNLYGAAYAGGAFNCGTLYSLKTDGSGFTTLHDFECGVTGRNPFAAPTPDGAGNLWGTTRNGGSSDLGTIYRLKTDGSGFAVVHSFSGLDGAQPFAALTLAAGALYGSTLEGGQTENGILSTRGVVFRIGADGQGFAVLHNFAGGVSGGDRPYGQLAVVGSLVYGTTWAGGTDGLGTVFSFSLSNSTLTVLHSFFGKKSTLDFDGSRPIGGVVHVAGVFNELYGTTSEGGAFDEGTVFRVRTNGASYTILRNFAGLAGGDGASPYCRLARDGSGILYGTTYGGGATDYGTVFRLASSGASYEVLHSFAVGAGGRTPQNDAILVGSDLYGTLVYGGDEDVGAVFKLPTAGGAATRLHSFSFDGSDAGPLAGDGAGSLYGMTAAGGAAGLGTVFRIGTNGTGYTILRSFAGGSGDGAEPEGGLAFDGVDTLYGTTTSGGSANAGTVFRMKTNGTDFGLVHSFTDAATGFSPRAAPVHDGAGTLYGTAQGGASSNGVVYKVLANGTGYQVLHSFGAPPDGAFPDSPLVLREGFLYGTTPERGQHEGGIVFKKAIAGPEYLILHHFAGGASDGSGPRAGVTLDASGNVYGTTRLGGTANAGTVFRVGSGGSGFTLLHSFVAGVGDGSRPESELALSGDVLYGTTRTGGTNDAGIVFKVRTNGTAFGVLHSFAAAGAVPRVPRARRVLLEAGALFGSTRFGGAFDRGSVFTLSTCLPGDANGDGVLSVLDVFFLINRLFAGGPASSCSADANADGSESVVDVFYLISHLFAGGPAPI